MAIEVSWDIAPDPPHVGDATVIVALADSLARPIQGAHVALEGTMTHPGMQPVFATAREVTPGRYEATLGLTMGGDWVFLLNATLPDGRTVHRQRDVHGVHAR